MADQNVFERLQTFKSFDRGAKKNSTESAPRSDDLSKINFYRIPQSLRGSVVRRSTTCAPTNTSGVTSDRKLDDESWGMTEDVEVPLERICMDKPWGSFYIYPELYQDSVAPMARIKDYHDLDLKKDEEAGILSKRIVATRISYISKNPLNHGHVAIKLSLSGLSLKNIGVLKMYTFIQYLDLSKNYLTTLAVLNNLPYLQFLMASYNQLPELLDYDKAQWFLTEVHYRFNVVSVIRDMRPFWSVTILDLSHNNITVINGLRGLRFLRRLDLSFNHIQRLESLSDMRLLWLDVSYNRISRYEYTDTEGLWTLHHLTYLNINDNMLTSLKIFGRCHRLRELHCRNNSISHVLEVALFLRHLLKLNLLDLRENPICIQNFYRQIALRTFPVLLSLDGQDVDCIEKATAKMEANEDIMTYVNRRLFRMLSLQQLSVPHVGPHVPAADARDPPLIVLAGPSATSRGTLCRRLVAEHPNKVFNALLHTTATCRPENRDSPLFHHVSVTVFNNMLNAGIFITYYEEGAILSACNFLYSISAGQEVTKSLTSSPPRACVTTMDHVGALLLHARGLRPHIILTIRRDEEMRKAMIERRHCFEQHSMSGGFPLVGSDNSMMKGHLSARIYIGGMLQEVLLNVYENAEQRDSLVDSLYSLSHIAGSYDEPIFDMAKNKGPEDLSICSIYKFSETGSVARPSDHSLPSATRTPAAKNGDRNLKLDAALSASASINAVSGEFISNQPVEVSMSTKIATASALKSSAVRSSRKSDVFKSKSVDFGRMKNETGPSGLALGSRSVTFQKKSSLENQTIEPAIPEPAATETGRSISKNSHLHPPPDGDLWIDFVTEAGLAGISDVCLKTVPTETAEDSSLQLTQSLLAQVDNIDKMMYSANSRNPSEEVHAKYPGVFSDTLVVDDLDAAYKNLKKIVKKVMNEKMEPLYEVEFGQMNLASVNRRLDKIQQDIAPCTATRLRY